LVLRGAAELQLGLSGINLCQTAITKYFKPVDRKLVTRKKIDWSDNHTTPPKCKTNKNKNKIVPTIAYKNRNLRVDNLSLNVDSGDGIYWEFKAG
jgi:hypothetical protein